MRFWLLLAYAAIHLGGGASASLQGSTPRVHYYNNLPKDSGTDIYGYPTSDYPPGDDIASHLLAFRSDKPTLAARGAKESPRDKAYFKKYHDDDDYARWAKDPNRRRGLHYSRGVREKLYQNPCTYSHCAIYSGLAELC